MSAEGRLRAAVEWLDHLPPRRAWAALTALGAAALATMGLAVLLVAWWLA